LLALLIEHLLLASKLNIHPLSTLCLTHHGEVFKEAEER
jgi:hypothetical protein